MTQIFESPDKGETVYVREAGSDNRSLYSESAGKTSVHESILENQLWGNIRRAALTNLALQIALDHVKLVYALTEDYEKRYGRSKT